MTKFSMPMLSFFLIFLLCSGCSSPSNGLEEVKGTGLAYSEKFKAYDELDERENVKFFKPIVIEEMPSFIFDQNQLGEKMIKTDLLPFMVDEESAYVVTSEDQNGKVTHQVQLSYLGKSEEGSIDEFFIISVTEMEENPVENYEFAEATDSVGNRFEKVALTDDHSIFQQVLTTDSALLYRYYEFDEAEEKLTVVGTAANEFYSYHDGFVYHIGYSIDRQRNTARVQDDMLNVARNFILGKNDNFEGR